MPETAEKEGQGEGKPRRASDHHRAQGLATGRSQISFRNAAAVALGRGRQARQLPRWRSGQGGGMLPALQQAVADHVAAAGGQQQRHQHAEQQQAQQQAPAEPSLEERRRLRAEAALRWLGGHKVHRGHPAVPPQRPQQPRQEHPLPLLPPQQQGTQQQARPAATVPLARQAAASGQGAHPSSSQGDVIDLATSSDDEELVPGRGALAAEATCSRKGSSGGGTSSRGGISAWLLRRQRSSGDGRRRRGRGRGGVPHLQAALAGGRAEQRSAECTR